MNDKNELKVDDQASNDDKDIFYYWLAHETVDCSKVNLQEAVNFERLLAAYKAKVMESYAHLFK